MSVDVLGIDPGETKSGWAAVCDGKLEACGWEKNDILRFRLPRVGHVVIEGVTPYSGTLSIPLIATIGWVGRFYERQASKAMYVIPRNVSVIARKDIAHHLVGTTRGGDAAVRDIVIQRYGGKDVAIGTKKEPGPLYMLRSTKGHGWAAFAAALTWLDKREEADGE